MRQLFLLLFYAHFVLSDTEQECFFPESELRPFFYEVSSSVPVDSVIADSLVDPPEAKLVLASIRSSDLPQINFTERFSLISEETGRFRLVSAQSLSLPSYPSPVTDTLLYATILCNNRPYPLMTIRLLAANTVAPSFIGEPYTIHLNETFQTGSEVDTDVTVVDWDPSPHYNVNLRLENNTSFELIEKGGRLPSTIEDGSLWKKEQLPRRFALRQTAPSSFPVVLRLIATENGNNSHSTVSALKLEKNLNKVASFSQCKATASIPENSPTGTHVLRLPIENYGTDVSLQLIDPDGSFSLEGDELFVANTKLMDRELFSTLEVFVKIENGDKGASCNRLRIRVELSDKNDNRPVFERESYWFHLSDEAPAGTEFAVLKARDVDEGDNGRVTYSLLNESVPFRLYPRGRDAVLATTHDLGGTDKYSLVVEASDHGDPVRTANATVEVYVLSPTVNKLNKGQKKSKAVKEQKPVKTLKEEKETVEVATVLTEANEETDVPQLNKSKEKQRSSKEQTNVLRGVVQAQAEPKKDLRELRPFSAESFTQPSTSTTQGRRVSNEIEESATVPTEDYGDSEETAAPFGFTSEHYFYTVYGLPGEDDVFGRVVAEPNPQMYGLERKVAGLIKVDADIGELAVGKKLYDQPAGNLTFAVSATDGQSTARAVVTVLFEPDKQPTEAVPRFDQTRYKFRVEEGVSPEVIGIVRAFHTAASSRSSAASLEYSIEAPSGLPFSVHPLSGEVVNDVPLDREKNSSYDFTVRACLSSHPEVCGSTVVIVSVGDVNDHAPRFSSSLIHVTLPSDVPVGTAVARVKATDEDIGDNGAITYQIVPASDVFALDANTGQIVTIGVLSESRYTLLVQATDHGLSPHSDATEVRIKVLGTNPSAPSFEQLHYEVVITPPTPSGAVVAQVRASDPDPGPEGQVLYRFAETSDPHEKETQSRFGINEKTGVVSSVRQLKAGEGPFDLLVEAYDGSTSFSRKTTALLHVEMGAEATLRFLPLPVTVYISTEKAVGSVVLRASASTTSSSPVRLRVLEENTPFSMDGDLLRVVSHLVPGHSQLTIRAETESLFADHRLTVIAMDDSDKYPIFPQLTYDVDVPQNSVFPSVVARFSARVRNGSVVYELHPDAPPSLSLDPNSGELTVQKADFAQGLDTAFVVVRGRNTHFPSFYSDVGVALNKIERRQKIRFGQSMYRLEVSENTPIGSIVSHPLDVFPKIAAVRFSFEPSDSLFGIHQNGSVFVRKSIDVEELRTTTIQMTAVAETDTGESTTSRLQIELIDENEFSPKVKEALVEGRVAEDAPPGTVVAKIEASDGDFSEGRHLLYRIVGGSGKDLVFIQEDGEILLGETPLDHEKMASFDVNVEVYDRNGNKASATAIITVEDVNDNAPTVEGQPLVWTVKENDPEAEFEFRAKDSDSGRNGKVTYRIVQGNGQRHFRVDDDGHGKGILRLETPLDFEEQPAFHLSLEAKDGGQPPKTSVFAVEVEVKNENDNAPVFKPRPGQQRVSADIPIGFPLATIATEDPDGERLRYLLTGDDCSSLTIDPLGVVSWSVPVVKRPVGLLNCSVTTTDGVHSVSTTILLDVFSAAQPTTSSPNRSPAFSQLDYSFVAEGEVGTRIGRVLATDPDGDQVLYSIKPAEYRNLFDVDHLGFVTLRSPIEKLSQPQYSFLVSAEDWGPPIMSTVANVHVSVPANIATSIDASPATEIPSQVIEVLSTGYNTEFTEIPTEATTLKPRAATTERLPKDLPIKENEVIAPTPSVKPAIKFTRPSYTYSIRGDSPVGTYLGLISLTYNKDVKLEVLGDGQLMVDANGRLRTSAPLTAEKINQSVVAIHEGVQVAEASIVVHVIGIPATRPPQPPTTPATSTTTTATTTTTKPTTITTTELPVLITNLPEEFESSREPLQFAFERPMYFAFVPEGKYSSGMKLSVKPEPFATNIDGPVHFGLANRSESLPFYVTEDGQLICFDVDREQRASFLVEVIASHRGEEAHATLNVTVLDVNDNYPIFVHPEDMLGLASDAEVGSTVRSFVATDADADASGSLVYSISGDAAPYFSIDRHFGVLTVSSPLIAAPQTMSLTVFVSDEGRPAMRSRETVTIKVFDAHSPAPLLPKITDTLIVPEDAVPGIVIQTLLAGPSVTGPSTLETVEYGLVDDYYGLFQINEWGQLLLGRLPHPLEVGRLHQLNVTAKNSLGTDSILVNVLLQGKTETSSGTPSSSGCGFEKNIYQVDMGENQPPGVRVANLKSTCPDPVFSFEEESDDFGIDEKGEIFTKTSLDREKKSLHIIYVNASPRGTRVERADPIVESARKRLRANQAAVIVRVLDENDNAPVFQHTVDGGLVAQVHWQARVNSPILKLQARDLDEKPHLIYSISNSSSALFEVDAVSGVVSLRKELKDQNEDSFEFKAFVNDGVHTVEVPVTIHKLSPATNIVTLTSELPSSRVKEFQVEQTLSDISESDVRVMDKIPFDGDRSRIYIYAVDRETRRPLSKDTLVNLLSSQSTSLLASPIRISSVSVVPSAPTTLSGVDILVLLLVLFLVLILLVLCCCLAAYCRRRRYGTTSSDREYMFAGAGPRPYDVEAITRQTAQTVLAQQQLPSPLVTHRDTVVSPTFADRGDTTRDFSNSVRERPSLLQAALSRQRVQPGGGSLSATVDVVQK